MKIEYLFFNLFIFGGSTFGCWMYPKHRWPKFSAAAVAIAAMSVLFIVWDQFVTGRWWEFNDAYILGPKLGKLPIEEVFFFLVIPWSCLIIWENLRERIMGSTVKNVEVGVVLAGGLIGVAGLVNGWWYTATVGVLLAGVGGASYFFNHWLRKKAAWIFLGLVCGLTIVFNNYLTTRPIVRYFSPTISGVRIGTMPIEDVLYGVILLSGVVMVYEFQRKKSQLSSV